LEADFRRFYALDLGAACFGADHLGARRLRVLVQYLPPDSSLARAMGWWWTDAHELSAQLVELAYVNAQAGAMAASGLTGKRFKPDQLTVPRPQLAVPAAPVVVEPAPLPDLTRQSIRNTLLRR